jgi:3-oxoacyl-[acyl-carrier-protein] synthase-3
MTSIIKVGIAGTGSHVPERVMSNDDFARIIDTSDEWIAQRTGIRERRFVAEGECTSDLSYEAAQRALADAGVEASDVDLIIVGTVTPDQHLPAVSCQLQERLGAPKAAAFDVGAACSGFMVALDTAASFVATGRATTALVIGAETLSRWINMEDRGSCILFGDGAGAAILQPHAVCSSGEILNSCLGADGSGFEYIQAPHGGYRVRPSDDNYDPALDNIMLRGRDVYRFAVNKMTEVIEAMCEGYDRDDIALLVPHQVNQRIIESALAKLEWDPARCVVNIDKYGNTSAASVPIALDEACKEGRLKSGDLAVLVAFGAGLTWGGALVRW